MKSGQIYGPAKKKHVAGWHSGVATGIVLVAVSMPFPLNAAVECTQGTEGAAPVTIGDVFCMAAAPQYLVAQARDTMTAPVKPEPPKAPAANGAGPANDESEAWRPADLGIADQLQDWLARANREFQTTIIRRLSTPPPGGASDDEIARKLEEVKKQDARAAAAKRAEDERKAAEAERAKQAKQAEQAEQAKQAKLAEQATRQAAEAKRLEEAREAADMAAQKAAEDASRKAAEEASRKAAEEVSRKAATEAAQKTADEAKAKPLPPTPQPASKPEDSARLADEMRQERARLEAEAERIEAQRKAAEATRSADERAQDEARVEEDRRRAAAAADSEKNRTRKIVLSTEPIQQPKPENTSAAPQPPPEGRGNARAASYDSASGPVVRRWVWRAENKRCRHAGRRISPPGRYTVRRGDNLWLISRRHYRSGWLYRKIYRANRSIIRDPDLIYPCQRIFVPRRR